MGLLHELDILLEVVKWIPLNPFGNFIISFKNLFIYPEHDILSPAKFNLSDVNVKNVILLLNLTNQEFTSTFEEQCVFLIFHQGIDSYEIFHISSLCWPNMEPNITCIISVFASISFISWNNI